MKKLLVFIILIIFFNMYFQINKTYADYSPTTTDKFLIVGGVLGGIELIHLAINFFSKKKENIITNNTNGGNAYKEEEIDKEAELKKLLSPSKLLTLINKTNTVISTNKTVVVSFKTNSPESETITNTRTNLSNTNVIVSSTITNYEIKTNILIEKYKVSPETKETNFTYSVTNTLTKKKFEYTAGAIDYYDVGVAYFYVNKKKKAKEYLLHTIAINKMKKEAIEFLMKNYKITLKEIRIEAKKYKTLKK